MHLMSTLRPLAAWPAPEMMPRWHMFGMKTIGDGGIGGRRIVSVSEVVTSCEGSDDPRALTSASTKRGRWAMGAMPSL